MSIEAALFAHLTTDEAVAALVGNRVYPKLLPQKPTYPAIVYHRISGAREHSHDGSSGLARPRFQLDMFALTSAEAKSVATAVRECLDGFRGMMGAEGNQIEVGAVFIEDDDDWYDDEFRVHAMRADYLIWHAE